jgi:adenosylmethionine-8-amino-7-oxononanoate aminotransferase
MNLSERDKQVMWHPYTQSGLYPDVIGVLSGSGTLLHAEDGTTYIDAIASWWVNLHGHAHPYMANAIAEQVKQLEQVIFAGHTHEPAVVLAERLLGLLPWFGKAFYSDNGSTAVEAAIKMSIQYWRNKGEGAKRKILAIEHSYHGDTFGAMSVSERGIFTEPFQQYLFPVDFVPFPANGEEDHALKVMEELLKKGDVAAFIAEPLVLGSGGMLMYDASVLEHMFALCKKYNALIIADEVMTGFGRTGTLFASQQVSTRPDMMCMSKGLTGGYLPMGLTLATNEIHDVFVSDRMDKMLFHGHSYTANPIACAAGVASLDLLLSEETQKNIQRISEAQREFVYQLQGLPRVINARSTGIIAALDLDVPDSGYASSIRKNMLLFFKERGILLRPLGNVLYVLPPYCITSSELESVQGAIVEFLTTLES